MTDINETIIQAESKLEKLRMQAEQEKAMKETLPIRFAGNISSYNFV